MGDHRLHVNGKYMAQNVGRNVVITGFISKLTPDGKNVELNTFDKMKINVALNEPYKGEATGIMRIFGKVQTKGTLIAEFYTRFPQEAATFDPGVHNDFIEILNIRGALTIRDYTNTKRVKKTGGSKGNKSNINEFPGDSEY